MALVVFLRGANVGGKRVFRPAAFARELAPLEVVNVGAAGTFVVRGAIGPAKLRSAFLERLPFETELMICSTTELAALALSEGYREGRSPEGVRRFLTILSRVPRGSPLLPVSQPAGKDWQVKLVGHSGRFVLSLWRRGQRALVYPNEVVERHFGVPATTRGWDTISSVCKISGGSREPTP